MRVRTLEEAVQASSALQEAQAEEEAHAALTLHLIEAEWLQKMRDAKLKDLLAQFHELSPIQRCVWDLKRRSLETLAQGSADLAAQAEASQAAHQQLLDSAMAEYEAELQAMHTRHTKAIRLLRDQVAAECAAAAASHEAACKVLQEDMAAMRQAHTAAIRAMTTAFNAQTRALKDFWDERCGVERLLSEEKLSALDAALRAENTVFEAETRAQHAQHNAFAAEDAQDAATIAVQSHRLADLEKEVAHWRERLAEDAARWREQASEARGMKGAALEKHVELQREVAQTRKEHETRVKELSSDSAAAEKELTEVVERAERVAKALELQAKATARRKGVQASRSRHAIP